MTILSRPSPRSIPGPHRPLSRGLVFGLLVVAVAASGASCPQVLRGYQVGTMPLPRALPPQASLDQIIAGVHDNTQRVRSYMAPQAVLVVPGVPRLSAQVACEPPRRFRLRAQTAVDRKSTRLNSSHSSVSRMPSSA